ncbi:putative myosin light chain kinase 3-like [Scophthalmus maximus]|uniref:Putative myosin light chain kinase 3-like n=1 Tax=Scophthalmus maximus TaxID=52904 RepID=A0A2U9C1M3_SCOMX|nr:putative myosin light chain kinase 3-like [Scophthalmus maximus]
MRDMGGKEKTILVIANVPNYRGSDKKTLCSDPASARKNGKLPPLAVPPPIPMSPIVEKMEGLKAIRNRSNSLRLGRLAFYRHLEKVETMRCFWELKHVELEGGNHQESERTLLVRGNRFLLFIYRQSDMSSSLVNSLAKVYDPNPLHGLKPGSRKTSLNGADKCQASPSSSASSSHDAALRCVESRMDSLATQMERLLSMQQTVLTRLDGLSQDVRGMGRDPASTCVQEGPGGRRESGVEAACRELRGAVDRASERMESQGRRLEGVEKLVEGTQQVISFIGEVVKSSRLVELLFKQPGNKANKKDSEPEGEEENREDAGAESAGKVEEDGKKRHKGGKAQSAVTDLCKTTPPQQQESPEEVGDVATCSKRRVTEEDPLKDELKKSKVENADGDAAAAAAAEEEEEGGGESQAFKSDEAKTEEVEEGKDGESAVKEFVIGQCFPTKSRPQSRASLECRAHAQPVPRVDSTHSLVRGRFGQVHKCTENSSGLTLAAKIIKARSQKEKEVVRNEIQVMNQLNHANLIQLYAAFESRHDIILVMEYVEGGELFDRIIDENYNLTELDTVLFIRQICEGLQYMHRMYILHLDLKPENILCVSRATNKIKIIDFGLARRYKPREKLKVNFGTPEFLAPEVINYEFVSFPTDMWSLGVITYMLLSGLSPFLGDDDNETLNNILACQWNFEEEEFTDISDEAKDFITLLLVKSKSWRMSATESLRHPWLSDRSLHYRLNQKKTKCHSTHTPSPSPES